jgi:hypothetical protein
MPDWKSELKDITDESEKQTDKPENKKDMPQVRIDRFIEETVDPPFKELKEELAEHGRKAVIDREENRIRITVYHGDKEEFRYSIEGRAHRESRSDFPCCDDDAPPTKCQARVVLSSGANKFRDLSDFSREGIIDHFLRSYKKWMGWEKD